MLPLYVPRKDCSGVLLRMHACVTCVLPSCLTLWFHQSPLQLIAPFRCLPWAPSCAHFLDVHVSVCIYVC